MYSNLDRDNKRQKTELKRLKKKAKQHESKDEWFKIELCFEKCISSIYYEEIESQNRNINLIENERLRITNNKNMELYLEEEKRQKLLQLHQKLYNKLVKL